MDELLWESHYKDGYHQIFVEKSMVGNLRDKFLPTKGF